MPKNVVTRAASKAVREEEASLLYDLVYDKLRTMGREIELFARMTRVNSNERDSIILQAQTQFLADQLYMQEFSVAEITKLIADGLKNAEEQGEAETDEEDEDEDENEDEEGDGR